jgi:membrane protein
VVSGVLALVAGFVAVALGPIGAAIGGPIGALMAWLRLPIAGLLMMLLWALAYYVLPDVQQRFKFITPGSVVGVIVWVVASYGFSKYVSNFGSYDKTYGSLGGVIVLLLWMWISSLVVIGGAEVNAFIEHRSPEGKRQGAKSLRDAGTTPIATVAGNEPVPVGTTAPGPKGAAGPPADERRDTPHAAARSADGRPRLRGVLAIATGFMAGVLVARRSEA